MVGFWFAGTTVYEGHITLYMTTVSGRYVTTMVPDPVAVAMVVPVQLELLSYSVTVRVMFDVPPGVGVDVAICTGSSVPVAPAAMETQPDEATVRPVAPETAVTANM